MAFSKYYRKYSAREDYWSMLLARILWAGMVFFIVLGIEIVFIVIDRSDERYYSDNLLSAFIDQLYEEDFSFVYMIQHWPYLVIPIFFTVVTLIYPNALRKVFTPKSRHTFFRVEDEDDEESTQSDGEE